MKKFLGFTPEQASKMLQQKGLKANSREGAEYLAGMHNKAQDMLGEKGYANGGDVAMEDFQEMNGYINGPGTETSDDIPAMLSDGEFVMTGQAVRGAGSFELSEEPNGILTLVPSASEDRERGTQLMYQMMDVFGRYANATN